MFLGKFYKKLNSKSNKFLIFTNIWKCEHLISFGKNPWYRHFQEGGGGECLLYVIHSSCSYQSKFLYL